uniref:Uncharacterized protein n=1 Tax=Glossina austeni TaxID=7395 RepID=A0A1A9UXP0_GLOAU
MTIVTLQSLSAYQLQDNQHKEQQKNYKIDLKIKDVCLTLHRTIGNGFVGSKTMRPEIYKIITLKSLEVKCICYAVNLRTNHGQFKQVYKELKKLLKKDNLFQALKQELNIKIKY